MGFLTSKGRVCGMEVREKQGSLVHDHYVSTQNEKLTDYGANVGKQTSKVSSNTVNVPIFNSSGTISYAKLLNGVPIKKSAHFRTLPAPADNGAVVLISKESDAVELKDTLVVDIPKFKDEGYVETRRGGGLNSLQ
ncbi:hypothetical protein Tco_1032097, partial [Tanacetum coccineum]